MEQDLIQLIAVCPAPSGQLLQLFSLATFSFLLFFIRNIGGSQYKKQAGNESKMLIWLRSFWSARRPLHSTGSFFSCRWVVITDEAVSHSAPAVLGCGTLALNDSCAKADKLGRNFIYARLLPAAALCLCGKSSHQLLSVHPRGLHAAHRARAVRSIRVRNKDKAERKLRTWVLQNWHTVSVNQ